MECYKYYDAVEFKGKTLVDTKVGRDTIAFSFSDGSEYVMFHEQDCCEQVLIENISGDIHLIFGKEIIIAKEDTESGSSDDFEWWTRTKYTFSTEKESVVISWLGVSNGYYSESVQIKKTKLPTLGE